MSNEFVDSKAEHVFDYSYYMNKIDDLTLTVIRGHLLVEQRLYGLADKLFASPKYLEWEISRLSFKQLVCVVRAAVSQASNDIGWDLILKLNVVRNLYGHK